ncbi:MAG TPA: hypothetical protein VFF30_08270 [Nitrososphaerales archaeon]|nr:hypothetical protein [Nitrososphaerales archaeon]
MIRQNSKIGLKYRCAIDAMQREDPNSKGWYVGHFDSIGLRDRKKIEEIELEKLKTHFIRFMDPGNMLLVPKEYAGLAELPEFCHQIKSASISF